MVKKKPSHLAVGLGGTGLTQSVAHSYVSQKSCEHTLGPSWKSAERSC